TGASSGVGQSTARLLAQNGYRVFGTGRNPSGAEAVPGVEMLALDVCSDKSVTACVDAVIGAADRIDVLLNNAAYELTGAPEETSLDEARGQFDTNFFGGGRKGEGLLPLVRRRREGGIVNAGPASGGLADP